MPMGSGDRITETGRHGQSKPLSVLGEMACCSAGLAATIAKFS